MVFKLRGVFDDTLSLLTDVDDLDTVPEDVIDYISRINNID